MKNIAPDRGKPVRELSKGSFLRILLIANFQPDGQESMARFCELIRRGMADRGDQVAVLCPKPVFVRLLGGPLSVRKWLGYLDKYLVFPFVLWSAAKSYDVIHICDHSNAVYVRFLRGKRHLVTCHDLLAVRSALGEIAEHPTGWSGRILQRAILRGLERAEFVACVSETTRRELLRLTRRDPRHTSCIFNGLNYSYRPMESDEAWKRMRALKTDGSETEQQGPFFLHVGGNQWYKNRLGVLKIFARLRAREDLSGYRLIMAGKPFLAEMRELSASEGIDGNVIELTSLPNEDLCALYSLAAGLIFPSLAEGFGWPIIEAQACGCPVFTSNQPPMNEIGGGAARYFDPGDPSGAAEVIVESIGQRTQMAEAGFDNARRYDTEAMLQAYREAYLQCFKTERELRQRNAT